MTAPTNAAIPATHRARPSFTPFLAQVAAVQPLSEHFTRITFIGPELRHVRATGYDQRIKLVLPLAEDPHWEHSPLLSDASRAHGSWWDIWRALPNEQRNVIRTYTLREVGTDGRVSIDFVTHADAGPAGTFAMTAKPGDTVVLVAPDARSNEYGGGIDFHPGIADTVLLVGDETAVPAIAGIIGSLAKAQWAGSLTALLEVPSDRDELDLPQLDHLTVRWLPRNGGARGGGLIGAVNEYANAHAQLFATRWRKTGSSPSYTETDVDRELLWETNGEGLPQIGQTSRHATGSDRFYVWVAGEAAVVRDVRRMILRDHGLDRKRAAFMGYWRSGRSEN